MSWDESTLTLTFSYSGENTVPQTDPHEKQTIRINVGEGFTTILGSHFNKFSKLQYLNLPDSITAIGNNFLWNTKVVSLHIPLNYKDIASDQPFDNEWTLEKFTIDENHQYLAVYDDSLYTKDMKTLIYYPGGTKLNNFMYQMVCKLYFVLLLHIVKI